MMLSMFKKFFLSLFILLLIALPSYGQATSNYGVTNYTFLAASNGTGNGTAFAIPQASIAYVTYCTSYGTAPASITLNIQVSLDNSSYSTFDTSTSTAGECRSFFTSAKFLRGNVSAVSGGTTTTVSINIQKVNSSASGSGTSFVQNVNRVFVQDGTAALPSYTFANESTTGFYRPFSGAIGLGVNSANTLLLLSGDNTRGFEAAANYPFSWSSSNNSASSAADSFLFRDGTAGVIAQRNSTNAQRLNVANTFTSSTNREDFSIDWQTTANTAIVGTRTAATGTTRELRLVSQTNNAGTNFATVSINRNAAPYIRTGVYDGTLTQSSVASTGMMMQFGDMLNVAASGNVQAFAITPVYNQTTATTANTDLLINRTETSVGSGQQNLVDLQVGGVSRYRIDNAGATFANTVPTLAYVATSDFATSGVGTNLETITGLTFALPANTILKFPFSCKLKWSQATAAVVVSFGLQTSALTPTNFVGMGQMETNLAVTSYSNVSIANTTATVVVSGTPAATATIYNAYIDGFLENPSGAATNVNVMVKTATQGDIVTVYRDSWCRAF